MWLLETFGSSWLRARQVVDVAGGRGLLAYSLLRLDGIKTTLIDPRAPTAAVEVDEWAYCKTAVQGGRETRGVFGRGTFDALSSDAVPRSIRCKFEATLLSTFVGAGGSDATVLAPEPESELLQELDSTRYEKPTDVVGEQQVKEEAAVSKMHGGCTPAIALLESPTRPVLLGLHACAATETIVDCALSAGLPFAVVPCCGKCSSVAQFLCPPGCQPSQDCSLTTR
jgi:hypothetical protein